MSRHNRERRRRANSPPPQPKCDYCPHPRATQIFIGDKGSGTARLAANLCEGCFTKLKEADPWTAERFRYGYLVEMPQ